MDLFRKKQPTPIMDETCSLRPCLTAWDLTLFGIGAIIGAGVFVLTGIAAATKAGPAISLSYVMAGLAAMFAALAYAELAAAIGGCGSAYNYAFAGFGEIFAWIIGWDLLLEYSLSVATVAIGWSGYVNDVLLALKIHVPNALLNNPFEGGVINIFATGIILIITFLLCMGVKQSARFNAAIVFIKLLTIAIFIVIAIKNVHVENWQPFLPFGWNGVMQGAALVFFAYIGFDALSTAAEETLNPKRDMPIGIIASMIVCTTIYILVSVLLTGIVPYSTLNVKSPVAESLLALGHPLGAGIVAAGAIAGLTTVILVMYYGLSRILLAIARDGLLPAFFAKISPKTHTPTRGIVVCGTIIAIIAGLVPIHKAAELVNIGTLTAFTLVCIGVMVLRKTHPEMERKFRLPFNPLIPVLGIIFCGYLMFNLPSTTWWRFVIWMGVGIIIYFANKYLQTKKT